MDEEANPLVLAIDAIRPYPDDPRRVLHPDYARLKGSIQVAGIIQPLVVTVPPGEDTYTIAAGGNTRLRILTELYRETGDPGFAQVPCVLRPWRGESDLLLAHLTENDLRAGLSFIDKARAFVDLAARLAAVRGRTEPSQREYVDLLKGRGLGVSQTLFSQLAYALIRLLPALPQALEAGMGRPQVERLRALDRAVHTPLAGVGARRAGRLRQHLPRPLPAL